MILGFVFTENSLFIRGDGLDFVVDIVLESLVLGWGSFENVFGLNLGERVRVGFWVGSGVGGEGK